MAELDFIAWLKSQVKSEKRLAIGIGDDTAELYENPARMLFAADMLMDGVHFTLAKDGPLLAGRKALAVNLSDIAAMGGKPLAFVASLAVPRQSGEHMAQEATRGMMQLASQFDVILAGGDTNTWDGPLVINVAILGSSPPSGAVRRDGAKAGDWILVTGDLGGSILGHHLTFTPRLKIAELLCQNYQPHAMLDLSDGLALDLRRILSASQCGAILEAQNIPISSAASSLKDGKSPLDHALSDGEDFELCFTMHPEQAQRLLHDKQIGAAVKLSKIGEITASPGLYWNDGSEITQKGYTHEFS